MTHALLRPSLPGLLTVLLLAGGVATAADQSAASAAAAPTAAAAAPTATASVTAAPMAATTAPAPAAAPAPAPHSTRSWLVEKYRQGGATMHFFVLISIALLAIVLERLVRLRRAAIVPDGLAADVSRLWSAGDFAGIRELCAKQPSVLASMISFAVTVRDHGAAEVLAGAGEIGSRGLRRNLQRSYPLAVIATIAPLLGLFGTVFGLIDSFEMIASAGTMGDVKLLADGIAKAFICTAAGMLVAIPALAFYHWFKLRTTALGISLDEDFSELIHRHLLLGSAPVAVAESTAPAAAPAATAAQPALAGT